MEETEVPTRHAYLILAHGNWRILRLQLELLDDPRNHVFLHIDKSVTAPSVIAEHRPERSKLTIIESRKTLWADYSLVQATLDLLREATRAGSHNYYHLLSGVDLPIKTMDEIHEFFAQKRSEYISIDPERTWGLVRRVKYYNVFTGFRSFRTCKPLKALNRALEYLQRAFGVNRLRSVSENAIYGGSQWFSVTDNFARYVLSREEYVRSVFKRTLAPDEMFMQTLVMSSPFARAVYRTSGDAASAMRFIDWNRGKPYVFRRGDLDELLASDLMFARKFDEGVDFGVAEELFDRLSPSEGPPIDWQG